ncbi:MAG TPA: HlyD family secretion protein [Candidatus Eremiobacteraceae bacterium]|nr:HlyD family secretion protein [Candidatus Eremiobacteraceae bacterium]
MSTTQERLQTPPHEAPDGSVDVATTGRKRRFLIPIGIIVAIVGIIFGVRYLIYAAHHVSTDDAQIGGDITTISARVKGQVVGVYVHENQVVHKGDKLLKIDDSDYLIAIAQAKAALAQALAAQKAAVQGVPLQSAVTAAQTAQAEAGIAQASGQTQAANAGVVAAEGKLAAAQAQANAATADAVKAQHDLDRAKQLVAEGAIPRSQWDAAQAAYDNAIANQQSAQHDVSIAQAGITQASAAAQQAQAGIAAGNAQLLQAQTGNQTTDIKVSQAQTASAQVTAARAALASAELQLSYTNVTAPIDGVISKKSVDVGDMLAVSQPVMAIASTNDLYVVANLKETQITNVRVGQPVEIKVDAYPGRTFTGKVLSLSAATGATFALIPPDNASGNFTKVVQRLPVRTSIDASSDPEHMLKQGLSAEISIDTTNH